MHKGEHAKRLLMRQQSLSLFFVFFVLLGLCPPALAARFEAPFAFLISGSEEPRSRSSDEPEIQNQIDSAMIDIMGTSLGVRICHDILGAQPHAIELHLGVSAGAARTIAQGCQAQGPLSTWVSTARSGSIKKMSVGENLKRHYVFLVNGDLLPFDSWTEPYTNTTVFVIHSKRDKPINRQRLIQLLAHETAVYFDSKAQLGHPDAALLPALRNLKFSPLEASHSPAIAVMNPLIAHSLTFVRALQVEKDMVADLVAAGKMSWPEEYSDRLISNLLSPACRVECLGKVVRDMREIYLPLTLPLVAFSPTYRAQKRIELQYLMFDTELWPALNRALDEYPRNYIDSLGSPSQKPFMEMIQFFARPSDSPEFEAEEKIFRDLLWPEDYSTLMRTRVATADGRKLSLIEFMKEPLLGGANISYSNGPRVRIRAGDTLYE